MFKTEKGQKAFPALANVVGVKGREIVTGVNPSHHPDGLHTKVKPSNLSNGIS